MAGKSDGMWLTRKKRNNRAEARRKRSTTEGRVKVR